jgi:hypothetical protein
MEVPVKISQLMVVAVLVLLRVSANAAILCVDPSNTAKCSATIQGAIDKAKNNDVIKVVAGTFFENDTINTAKAHKLKLTIEGAGAGATIVDGSHGDSVFDVGAKTTLTLSDMTIQHGERDAPQDFGGGVRSVGAKLIITGCLLTENSVPLGGGGGLGGVQGSLTVENSILSNNSASSGGGVEFFPQTNVRIVDSVISDNSANEGGGAAFNGTVTIRNTTISGNGALQSDSSPALGAGIFFDGKHLTVLDSTISENVARTDQSLPSGGGGLDAIGAKVTLSNVTIAGNVASNGGGVDSTGTAVIQSSNSIIAGNTATSSAPDCAGDLKSLGFNLIEDTAGCTLTGKTATDITGEDPKLGTLAINGSCTTETQAPEAGSPALEAGNPGPPDGTDGHCLPTDQCGRTRPAGKCDIGALQVSS